MTERRRVIQRSYSSRFVSHSLKAQCGADWQALANQTFSLIHLTLLLFLILPIILNRVELGRDAVGSHHCQSMEVTFGAVGDFISIGVLIKDFIELLDDSRGSVWEYNSLKQQLIFLRLNLDLAKRSYDEHYNAPQFQDIRTTLESVVDEAERRLEGIAVKVQKYTSTLSKDSTERRIKRLARKVQWSLEKKETEKFLLDLNRYTSIIQSLQFDGFT